ncbi:MAG: phosphatidylserine decarboxylase family protein [Nitrospiraceae bacterium]|nr:MAG: phosphatidylserine decarboxylase family protein [Nitrospiraceae bacterium]
MILGYKIIFILLVAFAVIFIYARGYYPIFFLRDPARKLPPEGNHIYAPADGRIAYIREIKDGDVPICIKAGKIIPLEEITRSHLNEIKDGYIVGIIMSFWNVHIQRAPISGKVIDQIYVPGRFFDVGINAGRMLKESERNVLILKDPVRNFSTITIQLAAIWVRRIVSLVKKGDELKLGQRYGYVKFGSQVDIIIPDLKGLQFTIKKGQKVYAGETIIARYDT